MRLYDVTGALVTPQQIQIPGYWYLGSPYTKYADGLEHAFIDVCLLAGELIGQGVNVYSPIAHTHPIAVNANIDPKDHRIWLPADKPLMDAAHGLIVAEMEGWRESFGLTYEIDTFRDAGKPVLHLVLDA